MSDVQHYTGGCHCGAVRYEVDLSLAQVLSCNCSICSKSGLLLSFVPAAQFHLLQGDDHLQDYQFNRKVIHHVFCKDCGIKPFARGRTREGAEMVAVNVRCLDGVDLAGLTLTPIDGRSM